MNVFDNQYIKYKHNGEQYACLIQRDELPQNPHELDISCTMICFHKRYRLGDDHNYDCPEDFLVDMVETYVCEVDRELSIREMLSMLNNCGQVVILPIYLFDHSGITMSTVPFGCAWDSGQVGWIYVDKRTFLRDFSCDESEWRDRAAAFLESATSLYAKYLEGDCYWYNLFELDKKTGEWVETGESCCGFYGSDIEESGIADEAYGLRDALDRGEFEVGDAEVHKITTIKYEFG